MIKSILHASVIELARENSRKWQQIAIQLLENFQMSNNYVMEQVLNIAHACNRIEGLYGLTWNDIYNRKEE